MEAVIFDMFETLITHYDSPLYFGKQMAEDIGIEESRFGQVWHATEYARTIGTMSFEEVIEKILRDNGKYSQELFARVINKRKNTKQECFRHIHREILPMLEDLKRSGYKVGLITNCFSEEAEVIRGSILFPHFDAACLSCEEGVGKPDREIFVRCMERLGVNAGECVYVGDGGSQELETARELGMRAVQAVWYLKDGGGQSGTRKDGFVQMENPLEVVSYMKKIVEM